MSLAIRKENCKYRCCMNPNKIVFDGSYFKGNFKYLHNHGRALNGEI